MLYSQGICFGTRPSITARTHNVKYRTKTERTNNVNEIYVEFLWRQGRYRHEFLNSSKLNFNVSLFCVQYKLAQCMRQWVNIWHKLDLQIMEALTYVYSRWHTFYMFRVKIIQYSYNFYIFYMAHGEYISRLRLFLGVYYPAKTLTRTKVGQTKFCEMYFLGISYDRISF